MAGQQRRGRKFLAAAAVETLHPDQVTSSSDLVDGEFAQFAPASHFARIDRLSVVSFDMTTLPMCGLKTPPSCEP